jgi:cell division protein ZapE
MAASGIRLARGPPTRADGTHAGEAGGLNAAADRAISRRSMDAIAPAQDDAAPPPEAIRQGPLPAYRALVAAGGLTQDPAQALAAERLQMTWSRLRGYDPPPKPARPETRISRFWRPKPVEDATDYPHGLYLVGEVGRGKSMLMDLFFAAADVPRKRRVHFHQFIQDAHARIFAWKRDHPQTADPIPPLADSFAAEAALLCFDEFQVNDIADAMILGRLFQALFERQVVVVATSNIVPDDLFKGQPGRDAFLPFIALIKQHLDILVLESGQDFRRAKMRRMPIWYVPANARADAALDRAFAELIGDARPHPERLVVTGRTLTVPLAAEGVARFDFATLCGTALGAGDYLALATHFHTLILDGVPRLSPNNYDEARRFIVLIDALYDHRVKLIASADAQPDLLYERGEGAKAFERTASRLEEMQSEDWLALPHLT